MDNEQKDETNVSVSLAERIDGNVSGGAIRQRFINGGIIGHLFRGVRLNMPSTKKK